MAAARKNVITRLGDIHAREHEERRSLEELTNAVREDVQGLVAQATQRVYQLRGRTVTITTPEASRRKKAARTEDAQQNSVSANPVGAEEHRHDKDAAGPSAPVCAREPDQPPPEQASSQKAPAAEPSEATGAGPSTAHVGQKRGRQAAASQAKSKRAKAQSARAAPAEPPGPVAATGGEGSPRPADAQAAQPVPVETSVPAAGPGAGAGPQSSAADPAAAGKPADTDTGAAAAPVQRQQDADAPVAQPLDNSVENGPRRTRGRAPKQQPKQPQEDARAEGEAGPSGTTAGAPAEAGFSPRVTRARRGQPAAAAAALSSPVAGRQTRGRNARQKRDVKEAQLGSPGLHPKTKAATEGTAMDAQAPAANATIAAAATPRARAEAAGAAGRSGVSSSAPKLDGGLLLPAAVTDQPGVGLSAREQVAGPLPSAVTTDEPGARSSVREEAGGAQQPAAATEHQPSEQPSAEVSALKPDNEPQQSIVAATTEPPDAGAGLSGQEQAGAQQLQQRPASPGPKRRVCAPPPPPPPLPPPLLLQKQSAASASNVRRMPAAIAATVALFDSKAAAAGAAPTVSGRVDRAVALLAARRETAGGNPANGGPAPALAPPSDAAEPERAADKLFSFGTKPKEQLSPSMPGFGPPAEEVAPECGDTTQPGPTETEADGMEGRPEAETASPTAAEDPAAGVAAADACQSGAAEQEGAEAEPQEEVPAADEDADGEDADAPDAAAGQEAEAFEEVGPGAETGARSETRNRSFSISLALRSPSFAAHGVATVSKRGPANDEQPVQGTPEPCGFGSAVATDSGASEQRSAQEPVATTEEGDPEADAGGIIGSLAGIGPADPEASLRDTADQREEASPEKDDEEAAPECRATAEASGGCGAEVQEEEEHNDDADGEADASADVPPVASAQKVAPAGKAAEAPATQNGGDTDAAEPVQPSKPKGGNLVSAVRSFLPQRVAPSPPPAAGKKAVKVKALEAAQAAKQKEAARVAERAARAAAADRQRQGQGDAGPSNANGRPGAQVLGAPRLTPTKAAPGTQVPGSARLTPTKVAAVPSSTRLTPTKTVAQQGADPATACTTTAGAVLRACQGSTTTAAPDEQRKDCVGGNAAAAVPVSVKAKAAFFQQKEEQAKRAATEQGAGRKAAGGAGAAAPGAAQGGVPSYKAGAQARVALAVGDNETALVASAAAAPAAPAPNASTTGAATSRGTNPAPAAAPAETVADKHKRVEAKRREEEERRRAELEARTKAKDDKLRNFEASKQQQRLGGGAAAGAPRPPAPPAGNPVSAQPTGKRLPLNAAGAGAGNPAIKPEPENSKIGPAGPAPAKTPAPKLATARTPGPKAGPVAANMVSPAVQLQVKLLPAVHAQGAAGGAPGLPKPRPAGATQAKQAQFVAAAAAAAQHAVKMEQVTPGATDLTEEERRNVHAIQTSPYIAQVKPRTPGMPTASKPVFNYEISPYRSDSDDEDEPGRGRKPVPVWAAHDKVLNVVQAQSELDADRIFGSYPSTIDIVRVFSDMPPPGDTDARGRPRRDYRRRGSSGIWDADF